MFGRGLHTTGGVAALGAALLFPAAGSAQEAKAAPEVAVTAKPGKGVTFEKAGDFKLTLRGRFQLLETLAEQEGDVDTETLVRRARVGVEGYVFDEDLAYKLELGFAPRDLDETGSPVLDAFIDLKHLRDLGLRIGQQKVQFDRQTIISSGSLQLVDRSPLAGAAGLDRDIGVTLHSSDLFGLDGRLGYALGIYGGEGRGRVTAPAGFLYVARAEFRPFGAFDDYVEADFARSSRPRLALAAAAAWNQNSIRTNSNRGSALRDPLAKFEDFEGFDYLHLGADAIFKWNGLSLLGEFLWREARGNDNVFRRDLDGATVEVRPRDTWGWFVQGGQMLGEHWEVVARYTEQHALGHESTASLLEDLAGESHELGGGLNWYVHEHSLKLQADYFRHWGDDMDRRAPAIPGTAFADGDNVVRVQLQAAF